MRNNPAANGTPDRGPPFAFIGTQFVVMTSRQILESLARDVLAHAVNDLTASSLSRLTADNFREWAKIAEPGGVFHAPEIGLHIVRLSAFCPLATSLSPKAKEQLANENKTNDRLKIDLT